MLKGCIVGKIEEKKKTGEIKQNETRVRSA